MNLQLLEQVQAWILDDPDPITAKKLTTLVGEGNESELKKYFSGFLEFGTAGLRGPMGPGPSCMNRAVVGRTALALATYMKRRGLTSAVIGRDARHGSEDFTDESAQILSGAGIKVFVLPRPLPTPLLAFAVKELNVDLGVMVTASHNPAQDNGYKVYLGGMVDGINYQGSQIISPADEEIMAEISTITSLASAPRNDNWTVLDESIIEKYIHQTAKLSSTPSDLKIVYTAMHGVGTKTIQRVFHSAGFASLILVDAQAQPDPDFPTLAFPNPEEPGAMDLALATAQTFDADLIIANDPDADRCAIALKDESSRWKVLRGDEIGAILGEYIAGKNTQGILANTIVSSSILKKIAHHHHLQFQETLTGFKWLSKVKGALFAYEEAIGFCVDPQSVNDKDGISAAVMLAQIATELAQEGKTLLNLLDEIWLKYGLHATSQISIRVNDLSKIQETLSSLRKSPPIKIAQWGVISFDDLAKPSNGLPGTDGLRFWLEGNIRIIIRPSGTEPKIKCYIEVITTGAQSKRQAGEIIADLTPHLTRMLAL